MDHSLRARQLEIEPIGSLLWKFSIPAILGTFVNATYNVADRIFIGQTIGEMGIAAATLAFPIMMVITGFGMMVGVGASTLISIRLGEKRTQDAEEILGRALLLFLILAAIFISLGLIFLKPLLFLCGATELSLPLSQQYLSIILLGVIFQFISFGVNSFLRVEGRPRIAMITMFIAAMLNIFFDWLFLCLFRTDIWGAALGTVLAQAISSVWILWFYISGRTHLKIVLANCRWSFSIIRSICIYGLPPFVMQLIGCLLLILQNNQLKYYGTLYGQEHGLEHGAEVAIAVLGILFAGFMLFLMPLLGLGQGMQPIVGYNIGAKKYDRVIHTLTLGLICGLVFGLGCYSVVLYRPEWLILPFLQPDAANRTAVVQLAVRALRYFSFMMPGVTVVIMTTNYFQSSGRPNRALMLTLCRQVFLLIPLLFLLPMFLHQIAGYSGIDGIWLAIAISDCGATLLACILLVQEYRRLRQLIR
ncbi:MAG: MATE family efflux transporter [Thermoguttaceae bacterium]